MKNHIFRKSISLLLALLLVMSLVPAMTLTASAAESPVTTRSSIPNSGIGSMNALAYNGNSSNPIYIAAGYYGYILRSTDGLNWTAVTGYTDGVFYYSAAYGAGLFVIIDGSGNIKTSPDGITWTTSYSGDGSYRAAKVVYTGSYFYAPCTTNGLNASVLKSSDGIHEFYYIIRSRDKQLAMRWLWKR
jgi:hypothetical protein